jgi:redox-sensitive bicupin YhaK (pirin superfamily)
MSTLPDHEPTCTKGDTTRVALEIAARPRDLGGFTVRRVLPSPAQQRVGPFIFFDHMGPADFSPGSGIDVRPHPHIGLATVTYLFDGEIIHKDTLGSDQAIRPGDVNWMLAGRGIAHSERSSPDWRGRGGHVDGIQSWVALPTEHEESAPFFEHHRASTIPVVHRDGVRLDVIAGTAFGERSPVRVLSPTLYVHAILETGKTVTIEPEHEERAFYVTSGAVECDGHSFRDGMMGVLQAGAPVPVIARERARIMIVGGAKLEGTRHIWWNFVSSSKERIERAKDDWTNERFGKVIHDEVERIPLPER